MSSSKQIEKSVAVGIWRASAGPSGGVQFRVWSPLTKQMAVKIKAPREIVVPMERVDGIFGAIVKDIGAGADYMYVIDGKKERADPVSRFQPDGVHGRSRVIDPDTFKWTDCWMEGARARRLRHR